MKTLCVLLLVSCALTRVMAQTSNTTRTSPATEATTSGTSTEVTIGDTGSSSNSPTTLTDSVEPASTPSTPTNNQTPSIPTVDQANSTNTTAPTPNTAVLSPSTRAAPANTTSAPSPTPTPTPAPALTPAPAPTPATAAPTPPPAALTPATEAPTAPDTTDQTAPEAPDAPDSRSEASNSPSDEISAETDDSGSTAASSWLVPAVVAAVVVLALLVITFYVRTRKIDDQDEFDRPSDIFFEAPRSNTNNYPSASGDSGNIGMPADEKGVIKAMRIDSTVTAASAAVPPASSKMHSDSVTGPPTHARNHQEATLYLSEPRFTLQQQVDMEQSQPLTRKDEVSHSPQATATSVDRSFELGASMKAGMSNDPSFLKHEVSAPGVTL